ATATDTSGPRWPGPVAAAVLLGLIGYGVATSTGSAPKAAPVTTISAVPRTTVAAQVPTTTVDAQPVLYYAADPPREYTVGYAERQQFGNDYGLLSYQLWATPDSSATTGSWFSVTTSQGASPVYATNSYRLQAGDLTIALSHTAGGHALAQFTTASHVGVTIASLGWSDDNLVRLATSLQANQYGFAFTDNWFTSDHQLISTVQPWLVVRGLPVEQIAYATSQDLNGAVVITVAQPPPADVEQSPGDRQIALRYLLDRTTPFSVDGHTAVAGTVIGEAGYSIATWLDGDNIITVGANIPMSQLIAIARTVHQVPASVWAGMQFQADRSRTNRKAPEATSVLPVSSGTYGDGLVWTIGVVSANALDRRQLIWSWNPQGGGETTPLDTAQINTVVDDKRTVVLADLPRAVAGAAELHVLRDGLDPLVMQFTDLDPTLDRTFAAVAFTEPGPYTAAIVGLDGTVYASWPSS
ncbi:MAG: hypothetical protein ACXV8L_07155, partial [Ilumatobacteraceae bacterium]